MIHWTTSSRPAMGSLITTNLCSDWRSFLAPSLSGSTFAKRLKTAEGTSRGEAGGADGVADEGESVEGACRDEGVGGGSRECGAGRDVTVMTQDGDEPGNAAPAATASAAATDSQECHHPKESGERMAACATCQQAIGQACQHMGDALGNASLVVTADGCFLLLQRGTAVGEFPNCPVFPGGHPEPSEAGISDTPQSPPAQHHPTDPQSSTTPASPPLSPTDSPSSSPSLLNASIAHEMFEGMKREVEEETGAPADSLVSSPPHTPHPPLTLSLSLSQSLAPSPFAPASPSSSPCLLNATIAHEMFEGMKGEVEEETGAPANSLVRFPPHTHSHLLSSATSSFLRNTCSSPHCVFPYTWLFISHTLSSPSSC
ncbi:unnamed protein product [Closterium sp. Naga37s-1]|nr:unnamed protein product [Closterium sp. Naga37s-1]